MTRRVFFGILISPAKNIDYKYKMARVRIPRSKRYRRKAMPSGRKPYRSSGMRGLLRPYRAAARPMYTYKQTVLNPTGIAGISVAPGATYLNSYQFSLSQVGGNIAAFSQLYDQYKINKVVITFVPKFNVSDIDAAGTTGGNLAMFASCIDYDDNSIPLSFGEVLERQNAKLHRTKMVTRVLKPCVNFNVSTGLTAGVSTKQSPWLDIDSITVPHFGVKIGITGVPVTQNYDIIVKYYLAFRQVK